MLEAAHSHCRRGVMRVQRGPREPLSPTNGLLFFGSSVLIPLKDELPEYSTKAHRQVQVPSILTNDKAKREPISLLWPIEEEHLEICGFTPRRLLDLQRSLHQAATFL